MGQGVSDIVQRLRDTAVPTVELCEEAASEIERLRHCTLTPLTLTYAEREAIDAALGWCDDRDTKTIATLRGLLERTG